MAGPHARPAVDAHVRPSRSSRRSPGRVGHHGAHGPPVARLCRPGRCSRPGRALCDPTRPDRLCAARLVTATGGRPGLHRLGPHRLDRRLPAPLRPVRGTRRGDDAGHHLRRDPAGGRAPPDRMGRRIPLQADHHRVRLRSLDRDRDRRVRDVAGASTRDGQCLQPAPGDRRHHRGGRCHDRGHRRGDPGGAVPRAEAQSRRALGPAHGDRRADRLPRRRPGLRGGRRGGRRTPRAPCAQRARPRPLRGGPARGQRSGARHGGAGGDAERRRGSSP